MTDIPFPPGGSDGRPHDPAPRGEDELQKLQDLHTLLIDTIAGYDKVLEKAEPEFVGIAEAFRGVHVTQAERVAALATAMGGETDDDGSFFGTVNRSVIEIRSWFDDIGHNILDALADGEQRVIDSIDAAIEASPSVERRGVLQQMRSEITLLLGRHAAGGS